jgi:hypothetical protein
VVEELFEVFIRESRMSHPAVALIGSGVETCE